jgi:predicted nicotinamide N-methyase
VAQPTHSSRHPHWHDRRRSGGSAARAHANASRRQDAARRDDNAVRADDNDDDAAAGSDGRRRARLNGRLPILSRTVPLGIPVPPSLSEEDVSPDATKDDELSVTIWEVEEPASAIELWWSSGEADRDRMGDPFGVVMWPGSVLAAREMHARRLDDLVDKTVLVLGAGTGLEAQAAALLGARRVVATDINALSLRLLEHGVQEAGLGEVVECRVLDLFGPDPLPVEGVDLVLVADVLYNQELGMQVGKRIMERLNIPKERRPGIIVTDSQRFHGTDFTPLLNSELERVGRPLVEWEERDMVVTTSGILIEEDQTYNVTARIISV